MSGFELIPAIDLLEGRCVRLAQGRYDAATVYGDDPVAVARGFAAAGISRLHVVDLDGAREGRPVNADVVSAIAEAVGEVPVQLGGGLRDADAVDRALSAGPQRVVLGTVALRDPDFVRRTAARHPGRIVVGIDARDGRVAVEGWLEASEARAVDLAAQFEDAGVAAIVYTDIARDGMLTGPNLASTIEVAERVSIPVIVSGGIGSEDDIADCAAAHDRGIAGAIVGRAIYTGAVDLPSALARIATPGRSSAGRV